VKFKLLNIKGMMEALDTIVMLQAVLVLNDAKISG
jgi:hypothetical protein